jgi:hypothetical protein
MDVKAYDELHYFDIGTITLGGVITQLDENSNPIESEKQYIQNKSKTTKITGFANEFPITQDLVSTDEVSKYFYELFRNRKTGDDLLLDHFIVELWNEVTPGVYKARKINQSVNISSKTGAPGEQLTFAGSLKGGEFVDGTFNVATKTFTETPASL